MSRPTVWSWTTERLKRVARQNHGRKLYRFCAVHGKENNALKHMR